MDTPSLDLLGSRVVNFHYNVTRGIWPPKFKGKQPCLLVIFSVRHQGGIRPSWLSGSVPQPTRFLCWGAQTNSVWRFFGFMTDDVEFVWVILCVVLAVQLWNWVSGGPGMFFCRAAVVFLPAFDSKLARPKPWEIETKKGQWQPRTSLRSCRCAPPSCWIQFCSCR